MADALRRAGPSEERTIVAARYRLERGDWAGAAAMPLAPRAPALDAVTVRFTRALGLARTGRAEAARAGMIDLDGLRLLDLSGVKLGPNAEVAEAATLVAGLKRDKPYLFARSSSAPASAPPQAASGPRRATDMTVEEWRLARAELLRRR